jgi:hypothetical protein
VSDTADTAAEWLDAVSAVIHQWYEYQAQRATIEKVVTAIDELIRVHPAYKRTFGVMAGDVSKRTH